MADEDFDTLWNDANNELETVLNEIPHLTSLGGFIHRQNTHHLRMSVPSTSPGSFSGGLSFLVHGFSPSTAQIDQAMYQTPSTRYTDPSVAINSCDYMLGNPDLCENFRRMNVGEAYNDRSNLWQFSTDSDGFGFDGSSLNGTGPSSFQNYGASEGFGRDFCGYQGTQSSISGNSKGSDEDMKAKLHRFSQGYNADNLRSSNLTSSHSNASYSETSFFRDSIGHRINGRQQEGVQLHNPLMNRYNLDDDLHYSQRKSNSEGRGPKNPVISSQLVYPNPVLSVKSPMSCNSRLRENTRSLINGSFSSSILPMTGAGGIEGFGYEDSFIIQGRGLKYVVEKGCSPKNRKKKPRDGQEKRQELHGELQLKRVCENNPLILQPICRSLAQLQGYMYLAAKDQDGCRLLQKIFDEGTSQDVQIIFNEIIIHVAELMTNQFGNYLMQKLLEVCNEDQRTLIVLMVTQVPGDLIRASLNAHGTRVVQKLIETLKTRQQILLVVQALEPGFLILIRDLNGNHVITRCLECFSNDDNKFIYEAAAKFCVNMATHTHGCCVLNRCIDHSVGKYQEKLIAEVVAHALLLAQDAYGNYVVQHIIELKNPSIAARLISQLQGHYVYLSMQKCSSHVVERVLKYFEESHPIIIHELLSVTHFDQLLQDPFANYVIGSALEVSKGSLRASLVEAIRPHTSLRTSPYCKKIFSKNLLKK
ncbi:hypothetical protein NMG60_11016820 [Bertholletia excelsa]